MRNILLFLSCIFLLAACSSNDIQDEKDCVFFTKFPKEISVRSKPIIALNNKVGSLHLCDSFLVLQNYSDSSDYLFSVVDLRTMKKIHDKIKFGGDFGEVLNTLSCGLYQDSILWAHDIAAHKIVTLNVGKKFEKANPSYIQYDLAKFYYSVDFSDTSKIIANGDFTSVKELQKVDLKTQEVTNQFGEYSNTPCGMSEINWKSGHESFLFNKPTNDKAVIAARYTDQVELFDLISNRRIKIVKGPEYIPLKFDYITSGGAHAIGRNSKTRFVFVSGAVTNTYIYLLFSGNKSENPLQNNGEDVFVYDWNGSPVCRLKLDRYVNCITVSKNDEELYAVDIINREIIKTSFKL